MIKAQDYDCVMDYLDTFSKECIFTSQYPGQPKKNKEEAIAQYESPNNLFLGAFDGSCLIGVLTCRIQRPNHPWMGKNASFGITLLSDYYGQGLGSRLMILMEEWARKKGMHRLVGQVRHKNIRAIALYLKCGFEVEGFVKETAWINNEWYHEYHIGKILK